ncbi:MOSC domain-containing protein [Phenylobacterium sp.]|jgi:hypothetical protein|uniref:MOSC domain-containing protein n=1 Tax=Phenylobacterium sp. TaxID=1871053 RepID=UPI002F425E6F
MTGRLASIYRHPVKGFTPEALESAELSVGEAFPCDRLYAVENGPCGYDPADPVFIPKQKFAVLAAIPDVALARTAYDPATTVLRAEADGHPPFTGALDQETGRAAFAAWLAELLAGHDPGVLRVLSAAAGRPFMDHPQGCVSVLNLASVRDLEARIGRPVDPRRFRGNLIVEGWPAWAELDWTGRAIALGPVRAQVFKPIVRCAATFVNPDTAVRDIDMTRVLFDNYGHMHFGVYVHVTRAGPVRIGDACEGPSA